MNDKMREEFEKSPRFRGMDFTRSPTHSEYYDSPYANGAWDGWKASRETLVVDLSDLSNCFSPNDCGDWAMWLGDVKKLIEAQGLKVKP